MGWVDRPAAYRSTCRRGCRSDRDLDKQVRHLGAVCGAAALPLQLFLPCSRLSLDLQPPLPLQLFCLTSMLSTSALLPE